VDFGGPVEIGGLSIESGTLLHGDLHGVQSVPRSIVAQIPDVAAQLTARERALIALCQSGDFSLETLRTAVAQQQ
jgi:regulator of RNase E activity RraA